MRGGGVRKRGKKCYRKLHRVKEGWRKEEGKKSSWSKTKKPIDEFGSTALLCCVVHES